MKLTWRAAGAMAGAATVIAGMMLLLAGPAAASKPGPTGHKQTICHRTDSNTNPYVVETVDVASILKKAGHDSHDGPVWDPSLKAAHIKWGDIIPPFTYVNKDGQDESYLGKNMDGLGGYDDTTTGAEILANKCVIPGAPTTGTTTSTTTGTTTGATTSTTTGTTTSTTTGTTTSTTTGTSTTATTGTTSTAGTTGSTTATTQVAGTSHQTTSSTHHPTKSHGTTRASQSITVLGTSRSETPLASSSSAVSSAMSSPVSMASTTSPVLATTSGAPSATAHTGQSTGIAPYLILLGGIALLLTSLGLRRGTHRV